MKNPTSAKALAVICLFLAGCLYTTPPEPGPHGMAPADKQQNENAKKTIADVAVDATKGSETLAKSSNTLAGSAEHIKAEAGIVEAKVPEPTRAEVKPNLDNIRTDANNIKAEAEKVDKVSNELAVMSGKLQTLTDTVTNLATRNAAAQKDLEAAFKVIDSLKKDNQKLKDDRDAALQKNLMYLIIIGAIAMAISLSLFFYGNVKAIGGAIGGGALIGVALTIMAMTKIAWLFGLVGGLGFAVLFGTMIYYAVDYIRHKRGLEETIETAEVAKAELTEEQKAKVFGTDTDTGIVGHLQSDTTKSLVKTVRAKLTKKVT